MNTQKLYMAVKPDRYELPVAVAGSYRELSEMLGVPMWAVKEGIFRTRHQKDFKPVKGYRYYVIKGDEQREADQYKEAL